MNISKRCLLAIFLVIVSLILFVIERIQVNSIAQPYILLCGFLFFVVYCIKFYIDDYRFISSSFYQIFYYFGILVSASMISSGAYMYEIKQYGFANGIYWLTIVFAVIGLESAHAGYKCRSRAVQTVFSNKLNQLNRFFLKSLILGTLAVSLLILSVYGSPLNADVTRVKYWGAIAPSYLSPIRIFIFTSFILAVMNFYQKGQPETNTFFAKSILFIYVMVAIFLLGEKFTAAIFFVFVWLIVKSSISNRSDITYSFVKVFLILCIALLYVALVYDSMGLGYEFVVTRVALQGQVLWSVLNEGFENIIFGADLFFNKGILNVRDAVEQRYLPAETYLLNQDSGTSLSGFSPAITILLLGLPLAAVAHSVFSFYLGRVQAQLIQSVRSNNHIVAFLKFTIYFFLISIWYVGNVNTFKIVLLSYIACFLYQDVKQHLALSKKVCHV